MPQVLSPSMPLPLTASHTDDSFTHSASGQCVTPALTDLASHIRTWREHKTFKAQPMPVELKSSIAELLTSGLYSKAALAKQLGMSYNQISNIESNFVNHEDLSANQPDDLNFVPFKLVPHNQTINSASDSNSSNNNQVTEHLNATILNNQHITASIPVSQVKDIIIHKADGANLTLPANLPSELLYNITQLFLCSK